MRKKLLRKKLLKTIFALSLVKNISAQERIPIPDDKDLFIDKKIIEILYNAYKNADREYLFLLKGEELKDRYKIKELVVPKYLYQEKNYVVISEDSHNFKGFLGKVHNHLSKSCDINSVDYESFLDDKESKLEMIVCDIDRNGIKTRVITKKFIEKHPRFKDIDKTGHYGILYLPMKTSETFLK